MNRFAFLRAWIVPLLIGVVCVVLTMRTLLTPGFFRPHDFTHGTRITQMVQSLQDGELPVRWSRDFGFGYGMPLFSFYAPLPYYLGSVVYLFTDEIVWALKSLYWLNAVVSFVGMYMLGTLLWGKRGGLISAVVFSFSTYRAVDLFVRGAVGEVYAMAWIPIALSGVLLLRRRPVVGTLVTALGLAATILSHNLTGMLAIGLIIVWSVIVMGAQWEDKAGWAAVRRILGGVGVALLLAAGLSAFYAIPAFVEKEATRVEETITTGDFDFRLHFVIIRQLWSSFWGYGGSIPGIDDGMSFSLGLATIGITGVAGMIGLVFGRRRERWYVLGLSAVVVGSVWMLTKYSLPVWEQLAFLKYLQFPWRFLAFSHVGLSALAGALALVVGKRVGSIGLIGVIIGVGTVVALQAPLFVPEKQYEGSDLAAFYRTDGAFVREIMSYTLNDYLPPGIVGNAYPHPTVERIVPTMPGATVSYVRNTTTRIQAVVDCPQQSCRYVVQLFQFPGWQATLNGQPISLLPAVHLPVYEVVTPQGSHTIDIRLVDTPLRFLSTCITVITGALVLTYSLWRIRSLPVFFSTKKRIRL